MERRCRVYRDPKFVLLRVPRRLDGDLTGPGGSPGAACRRGVSDHSGAEVHRSGDPRIVERVGRLGTIRGPHAALLSGWCDVCVTRSAQDCARIAHTPNRGTLETVEQSINFRERRTTSFAW